MQKDNRHFYQYIESNTIEPWLFGVRRAGYSIVAKDFHVKRSASYPYCNLHYVEKGSMSISYKQKRGQAKAGQFFILPAYDAHSYELDTENETIMRWIEFDGSDSEIMVRRIIKASGAAVVTPGDLEREQLVGFLESLSKPGMYYLKSKILYGMLLDQLGYLEERNRRSEEVSSLDVLGRLAEYIDRHLDQNLKVSDLAQFSGYSTSYMIRQFKKRFEMTPGEYIYHRRVAKAKGLLLEEDLSLEVIAHQCGFYDASHLVHRFNTLEGMTPMAYRSESHRYNIRSAEDERGFYQQ